MDTLKNKVAVITGGTSGIGRATAIALAQEGARLVIADRDKKALPDRDNLHTTTCNLT